MKALKAVNLVLLVVVLLLALNLVMPLNSITGSITYALDSSTPKCQFTNEGKVYDVPTDVCCHEIQKQLTCKDLPAEKLDLKCFVSEASGMYYVINQKVFNYCQKEGYYVKRA